MAYPDFSRNRTSESVTAAAASPQSCPSCTSASILSTDKIQTATSYWRCLGCGEVWSPARRQVQASQRWRR